MDNTNFFELAEADLIKEMIAAVNVDDSLLVPSSNTFFSKFLYSFSSYIDYSRSNPLLDSLKFLYIETPYSKTIDLLGKLQRNAPEDAFRRLYKGDVFYQMAYRAFAQGEFESGIFFLDAAASEDLEKCKCLESPAVNTLRLDFSSNLKQTILFKTLMIGSGHIPAILNMYNETFGSKEITIQKLQRHFLDQAFSNHPEWRPLVTSWYVYTLTTFSKMEFQGFNAENTNVDFMFMYLLRGCLLFESLLKSEPSGTLANMMTIGELFRFFQDNDEYLKIRNKLIGERTSFDTAPKTLSEVVHNLGRDPGILGYINKTYSLRNTIGHNLVWREQLSYKEFIRLIGAVAISCLHVLSVLYCSDPE